jgi:CRP-like cAMP-binding protein
MAPFDGIHDSADHRDLIRVFDHDPDLVGDLDDRTVEHLRRRAVARAIRLEPGAWRPGGQLARGAPPGWLGLLVIDGFLTRCVRVERRDCPELLGAGDLLHPWSSSHAAGSAHWKALLPTTVAVLDERFAAVAGRWPTVYARLLDRAAARNDGLSFHLALAGVRRAETRLLMVLAHLAERWGRMTPEGAVLPLPLTHELLAHLASMRRPTATTALHRLMEAGMLDRRDDGVWLLPSGDGSPGRADGLSPPLAA